MKTICSYLFYLFLFSTLYPARFFGQEFFDSTLLVRDSAYYIIQLKDSSVYKARLEDFTMDTITFSINRRKQINIKRDRISDIRPYDPEAVGKENWWIRDPFYRHYFFAPSAIPLEKGSMYYKNIYLGNQLFSAGLTKNISVGAGINLPMLIGSLIGRVDSPSLFLNVNSGFKISANYHTAIGLMYLSVPNDSHSAYLYNSHTLGNQYFNLSLAFGLVYSDERVSNKPFFNLGGMIRLSNRLLFIAESYLVPRKFVANPDYEGFAGYGFRIIGKKLSFDIGLIIAPDIFEIFPLGLPYIDLSIKIK